MRRTRRVGVALLVMLFAAACGLKPGVEHLPAPEIAGASASFALPPGTTLDAEGNLVDAETGEIVATAEELESSGIVTAGGGGGAGAGGAAPPGGTDEREAPAPAPPPGEGNSTGVTDDTIKIGIHAPITGAAPIPSASFQKGTTLYWNHLRSKGGSVNGRDVEVVFRNDNYNPSQAVAACREMVEAERVFLLFGIAGTDQIQACAQYAASVGVPYVSTGVTELRLAELPNYFAVSMSYKQQGPLLTDMLVDKLGAKGETNGMVRFSTPTFQDAHDSFIAAMRSRGAPVDYDRAVAKTAGQSDAAAIATELNQRQIQNVYVLTSPTWFLQLANAAANQGYRPQWVGIGLTMSLDTVANVGCRNSRSIDDARFLNFFPAFADAPRFDPAFRQAGGEDDIQFGLWGLSKVIHGMLAAPGKDLTREAFIVANERGEKITTGVVPPVRYARGDHLGGDAMHLSRAECDQNRWVTEQAFVSDF